MANEFQVLKAALDWHLDAGADAILLDRPVPMAVAKPEPALEIRESVKPYNAPVVLMPEPEALLGASEARAESLRLALGATTLEELKAAIAGFEGISLKATATRMVFADGNPAARVMVVGEAPGADEDKEGLPFVGVSGQLLDRIMSHAGLSRAESDPAKALYISNIINWRPPGNRTPSPAEIDVSLPFIERHIQLVKPKILLLAGGVSAKALLKSDETISRLRGKWQSYLPVTPELRDGAEPIPVLATYHPSYLLRTPSQKRQVWVDMLNIMEKLK